MDKQEQRLQRQLASMGRAHPLVQKMIRVLTQDRQRLLRVPLAILLILCSFLSFLPLLGIWMLPVGLLLLAIDVPALQPFVSAAVIRLRRRITRFRRWMAND